MDDFKDTPPEPENKGEKALTVLLAEDDEGNILVTGTFLEYAGYACDVARDGRQALEKFKTSVYFAVLMDVKMPGICGFETTQMIREFERLSRRPRTPIIGLTAHALAEDRARCLTAGMDDYLIKPTSMEALARALALHHPPGRKVE